MIKQGDILTLEDEKDYVVVDTTKIDDIVYGEGTAHSKKEAEQLAAKSALKKAQS